MLVNLARALDKIETKADDLKFAEEIYAHLQRGAEVAIKVVEHFRKIYTDCLRARPRVNDAAITGALDDLRVYRNLLHQHMLATAKDNGVRLIPKRDFLDKYTRWTTVMYESDLDEFVPVEAQLRSDFAALCSALEAVWKEMEIASELLVANKDYLARRAKGKNQPDASVYVSVSSSGMCVVLPNRQKP